MLLLRFFFDFAPSEIAALAITNRRAGDENLRVARSEAKAVLKDTKSLEFPSPRPQARMEAAGCAETGEDILQEIRANIFSMPEGACLRRDEWHMLYDARDTTGRPTPLVQNQFGFAVGGPVFRKRTFFFGSYEQRVTRGSSSAFLATVPSPAAIASATSPTIRQIATLLPAPTSLNSDGQTGTLAVTAPRPSGFKQFLVRVDHSVNDRHTITARYYQKQWLVL